VVARYEYDTWGQLLSKSGEMAAENPYRYAGYQYDEKTGLYYLIARYYHPTHGVFLSMDPDPGDSDDILTQNGYTYANNNPVMLVDPDGHFFWFVVNAGFAAYDGYKAYKTGRGWKYVAKKTALGAIGGGRFKLVRNTSKYVIKGIGKLSRREQLLGQVTNKKLRNSIHEMFRPTATVGDGSLAAAVRLEVRKGILTGGKSHIIKAKERIRNLEKILAKENLSGRERRIANHLLIELKRALNGK
jgi:RHS repeat-associated protein